MGDLLLSLLSTRLHHHTFPLDLLRNMINIYWCFVPSFIPKLEWNFMNVYRIPEQIQPCYSYWIRLVQRKEEI